jgi:hypothetical protein
MVGIIVETRADINEHAKWLLLHYIHHSSIAAKDLSIAFVLTSHMESGVWSYGEFLKSLCFA